MHVFPEWASYVVALLLLIPLVGAQLSQGTATWVRVERIAVFAFCALNGLAITLLLWRLVTAILYHTPQMEPIPLLVSGTAIWIVNTCIFALLYWEVDAGGPSKSGKARGKTQTFCLCKQTQASSCTMRVLRASSIHVSCLHDIYGIQPR